MQIKIVLVVFLSAYNDYLGKCLVSLKNNSSVFLIGGKHAGSAGQLKEIKNDEAIFVVDGKDIETAKKYLFVVGDQKAEVAVN